MEGKHAKHVLAFFFIFVLTCQDIQNLAERVTDFEDSDSVSVSNKTTVEPFVSIAAGGFAVGCAIGGAGAAVADQLKTTNCAINTRVKSLADLRDQMMDASFTLQDWINRNDALSVSAIREFDKKKMMFDNTMVCVDTAVAAYDVELAPKGRVAGSGLKLPWQCYRAEGLTKEAGELHQFLTSLYVLPIYWQVLGTDVYEAWAEASTVDSDEACFLRYMQSSVASNLATQKLQTLKFLASLLKTCNTDLEECKRKVQEFERAEVTEETVNNFKDKLRAPIYRSCKGDPGTCDELAKDCGQDLTEFKKKAEELSDEALEQMENGGMSEAADELEERTETCELVSLTAAQFKEWRKKHGTAVVDEDEILTGVAQDVAKIPTWRPNFKLMGVHAVKRVMLSLMKDWIVKAGIRGFGLATFAGNTAAAAAGEGFFVSLGWGAYGNLFGGIGAAVCSFAYNKVSGHTGKEHDSFGDLAANFKRMCQTSYNCCCKAGPCGQKPDRGEDDQLAHESEEGCCMRRKWACSNRLGKWGWKYLETKDDRFCGTI